MALVKRPTGRLAVMSAPPAGATAFARVLADYGYAVSDNVQALDPLVRREQIAIDRALRADQPTADEAADALLPTLVRYYGYYGWWHPRHIRRQLAEELLLATLQQTRTIDKVKPYLRRREWVPRLWARVSARHNANVPPAPFPLARGAAASQLVGPLMPPSLGVQEGPAVDAQSGTTVHDETDDELSVAGASEVLSNPGGEECDGRSVALGQYMPAVTADAVTPGTSLVDAAGQEANDGSLSERPCASWSGGWTATRFGRIVASVVAIAAGVVVAVSAGATFTTATFLLMAVVCGACSSTTVAGERSRGEEPEPFPGAEAAVGDVAVMDSSDSPAGRQGLPASGPSELVSFPPPGLLTPSVPLPFGASSGGEVAPDPGGDPSVDGHGASSIPASRKRMASEIYGNAPNPSSSMHEWTSRYFEGERAGSVSPTVRGAAESAIPTLNSGGSGVQRSGGSSSSAAPAALRSGDRLGHWFLRPEFGLTGAVAVEELRTPSEPSDKSLQTTAWRVTQTKGEAQSLDQQRSGVRTGAAHVDEADLLSVPGPRRRGRRGGGGGGDAERATSGTAVGANRRSATQ